MVTLKLWRYMELESISHLRNDGRELLGHFLYFTEKRDGSCLAIWMKDEEGIKTFFKKLFRRKLIKYLTVSSRNREKAEKDIAKAFWDCEDRPAVIEYLRENPTHIVFGELLRKGLSPTRMEKHEKVEFIVFDIFDGSHFISYQQVHQFCFHYGMKCVQLFGEGRFVTMDSLLKYRDEMLELCKKERREGVVIKTLTEDMKPLYAKEKLDTASPRGQPKIEKGKPQLNALPESETLGSVDKVFADLGMEKFKNKSIAMPLLVKYIHEEARKHCCIPPKDLYRYYLQYLHDRVEK